MATRAPLVDQFVVIMGRADDGVFHSYNKFMHPVAPVSGSSFGHLPEFAFPDSEAVRLRQDLRMYVLRLESSRLCPPATPLTNQSMVFSVTLCAIIIKERVLLLQSNERARTVPICGLQATIPGRQELPGVSVPHLFAVRA